MHLYKMAHQKMSGILSITPITIKYCALTFCKALMGVAM